MMTKDREVRRLRSELRRANAALDAISAHTGTKQAAANRLRQVILEHDGFVARMHDGLDFSQPLLYTRDVFSEAECVELIERIRGSGSLKTEDGSIRKRRRYINKDDRLPGELLERVGPHFPQSINGMALTGINESFSLYEYDPGDHYRPHMDIAYIRKEDRKDDPRSNIGGAIGDSFVTALIYLNDDFTGGGTHFIDLGKTIAPKTGMVGFLQQRLLHEAQPVKEGMKQVIRLDALYR